MELERDLPGIQLRRSFLLVGLWLTPDTGRKFVDVESLDPSMSVELTRAETLRPLGSGRGAVCRVLRPCIGGRESFRSEKEMLRCLLTLISTFPFPFGGRPCLKESSLFSAELRLNPTFSSMTPKDDLSGLGDGGVGSIMTGLTRS
jgi:hypothetical protein